MSGLANKKNGSNFGNLYSFNEGEQNRIKKIISAVKDSWNEEALKINFVFPLCRLSNWKTDADSIVDNDTRIDVERYQPQKGRLDLLLLDKDIPRIVIECKRPSVSLVKNSTITPAGISAMKQAHRYAQGVRFWRKGCLPNVLSVVMNGKEMIWFDSSMVEFNSCFRTAKADIVSNESVQNLLSIIHVESVRKNDMDHVCQVRTIIDEREAIKISSTHQFSIMVLGWLKKIQKANITKQESLAMTLQILFLTIARDHGILGYEEIEQNVDVNNWDKLFSICKNRFNSNVFENPRPKNLSPNKLHEIYQESKNLPYSLEAIPVEYVGDIYETLLHNLHQDNPSLSKTSYFTPEWLVKDIIHQLNPTTKDTIFDPTCGSAAFLTYAFFYATRDCNFEDSRKFLEKNIYGVDRDELAVQVSRFSLLVSLARKVDGDWIEKEHILPALTNHIVCHDFLTYETKQKFTFAVGNPPWGSIDNEVKDKNIKLSLKDYESYKDKTDICVYVVEKAFSMLSDKGKIGFLTQRSVVDGEQHANFRTWWNGRLSEVWDFERDELFAPRNKALTAVLLGSVGHTGKTKIINKSKNKIKQSKHKIEGTHFSDLFYIQQGAQAAKNEVYELYAEAYPDDKGNRYVVSPEAISHGKISKTEKTYFIHPDISDVDVSKKFKSWCNTTMLKGKIRGKKDEVTKSCDWWLKNRAECNKFGWKRLNGKEYYIFDKNQMRIVFSYYLNGSRLAAGLDKKGEMVPLTSTTVLIPKKGVTESDILFTLAWLNSSIFAETEALKGKLAASGGRALYRDYVEKMIIPLFPEDIKNKIVDFISVKTQKGMGEHDLQNLDEMFVEALEISERVHKAAEKVLALKKPKNKEKRKAS